MRAMLDTSVLIGALPDDVIDAIDEFSASYVVRAELMRLRARFAQSPSLAHAARARVQLVETLDRLPGFWREFGAAGSDVYATLTTRSEAAARTKDALIAAHAIALDVPLMTADTGFTRFTGLRLLTV